MRFTRRRTAGVAGSSTPRPGGRSAPGRSAPPRRGGCADARRRRPADAVQASLDLGDGPAAARAALRPGPGGSRRGCSWSSTIWSSTGCPGGSCWRTWRPPTGRPPRRGRSICGAKTTSFRRLGRGGWPSTPRPAASTTSGRLAGGGGAAGAPLPVDRERRRTPMARRAHGAGRAGREDDTDALLQRVPAAYRTRINDVLLAALGRALCRWTGDDAGARRLEGHGREDDLRRALTSPGRSAGSPRSSRCALDVPGRTRTGLAGLVRAVRRQLRAVPATASASGRCATSARPGTRAAAGAGDGPQIAFNYLGQLDARPAECQGRACPPCTRSFGQDHDPRRPRLASAGGGRRACRTGGSSFTWYYHADVCTSSRPWRRSPADFADALRPSPADCRGAVSAAARRR